MNETQQFNRDSINAVLARIEVRQQNQHAQLDRMEVEQLRQRENLERLWKSHSNLRVKVSGIAALIGVGVAALAEWIKSKFDSK